VSRAIEVRSISKIYAGDKGRDVKALDGVSFDVNANEFVSVIGPSGCGKTSLLKMIAGLVTWSSGEILVGGARVDGPGTERALVFQDFALLPWRSVLRNVTFGLEARSVTKEKREEIGRRMLDRVGLHGFEHHLPRHLSGGMQQRVGLARALAVGPEILLLDEPFGSLDAQTKQVLQDDLLEIWNASRTTALLVTHSMEEAVYLSDRVVVMTARPGTVKEIVEVDLPRPRHPDVRSSEAFVKVRDRLWELLEHEVKSVQ
jgi:NitT/TauT family transport system ATP-binding protein